MEPPPYPTFLTQEKTTKNAQLRIKIINMQIKFNLSIKQVEILTKDNWETTVGAISRSDVIRWKCSTQQCYYNSGELFVVPGENIVTVPSAEFELLQKSFANAADYLRKKQEDLSIDEKFSFDF
jgi:hypothetical protein